MQDVVQQFIHTFTVPPSGRTPQTLRERFQHWIEVYAHPEQFTKDHSPHALAAKRKSARQCLRRLAERHPEVAAAFLRERDSKVEVTE